MKPVQILLAFLLISTIVRGQEPTAVPSHEWIVVSNQNIQLRNGTIHAYDFPASTEFDYRLLITSNRADSDVKIAVFDLQDQLISEIAPFKNELETTLMFMVPHDATYKVVLGITDQTKAYGESVDVKFELIRKPL
jgi:hypothetical protein